ncbi:hypothetical protein DRQ36_05300 [bacterium]|nr:MAG: hypothetical protein DRQ36_05300 [bacterium]
MSKEKYVMDAPNFKDWIKSGRVVMKEFVGKSGKSFLGFWFEDKSFALFQKTWAKDPFSHSFIPKTLAKRFLVNELEIEIDKKDYAKLTTYQIAWMILKGELKSKRS